MSPFYLPTWGLCFIVWGGFVLQVLATSPDVCRTEACTQSAEIVKRNMDSSVNPCDDFYRFACGSYVKNQPIDSDKTQASSFVTVNEILQKQLRVTIETPETDDEGEARPFKMAKRFYNICLRQDLIEARGVGFIVDLLRKAGGWPVLEGDRWDESKFNWVETSFKLHDLNLGGELFDVSITVDLANSFKRVLEVDQISFGLSREYLIKGRQDPFVQEYASYMADIAHLFGADNQSAVKELSDALDLEIEIAKIALGKEERRDFAKLYNPMRIQDLQSKHPIVDWEKFIRKKLNNVTQLRQREVIIVSVPSYLDKLQKLIRKTDNRTIANLMFWRAARWTVHFLTKAMRDRKLRFSQKIVGRVEHPPRWKECLDSVTASLTLAVGSLYVRNFFNEDAKGNANDMVERIRQELLKVLNSVDWMDEETRRKAVQKANAIAKHIAYPNELIDNQELEKFYEKLEVTGETYFESFLNISKFGQDYSLSKLREPINKTDWRSHSLVAIVNAFYNPTENSVNLPAGILQNVFFSHDRPRYMNYGGIGFVIAHEITHGFDDMGRQFDKTGNLGYWWKPETEEQFNTRVKCVIDQASNYTVESVNMKLNGINTQGENVADSGGIKLSHRAYNSWEAEHGQEPRLVGLEDYSPQQMFWLSAANVWCTAYRELALKFQITTGYHSPAEYRVNGAFRNQEAFAQDFQCPLGSKMNPVHKCNVW